MTKKRYETEDGARIAPLGELKDFEVAKGYPDIRGWRVNAADGAEAGKVHELLVDVDTLRTRYLDVRLTPELSATPHDRDVLVPIGAARIDDEKDVVVVPLSTERIALLPPFDHESLTRAHEFEVRRHFSAGEAAAASAAAAAEGKREFYDDANYDDRHFFSARHAPATTAEEMEAAAKRDVQVGETEVRVPVQPDESVEVKRGDRGRDEVIIRRPRA
jgi:photosynthetic reaction center H subunit